MIPKLDEYKKKWSIASEDDIKPGLEAIQQALSMLNNPEKDLKIIHVAGTNGKGSTIAFIESILQEQGYSTGVFTSPAIHDIHDQIRLNKRSVTGSELNLAFEEMKFAGISGLLTNFELLTVAAFCTFRNLELDYIIVETGMGGTFDSTNVVEPLVSIITTISIEHTQYLGTTIAEIAKHKAGIIKRGTPVVVGKIPKEALNVIQNVAEKQSSACYTYGIDYSISSSNPETFSGIRNLVFDSRCMKGPHQAVNAAVGLEALLAIGIDLDDSSIISGIANATMEHRFQEVLPNVFVDGAHNPAAAKALAKTIENEFPGEKVDFYIGVIQGKDIVKMLEELYPVANSFSFLTFDHRQAESAEKLLELCKHEKKSVTITKNGTIILVKRNDRKIIVTGSLYLLEGLKYQLYEK